MYKIKKIIIACILFKLSFIFCFPIVALDDTLERLDLSGFLRIRIWYTGSDVMVPSKFPSNVGYSSVDYQDLFFRNRFSLKVLPELEIRAVFDIGAVLGKSDFSMENPKANLVTRDVYAVINVSDLGEFSIGLQPFSFYGGYILARDASGIQYSHYFNNRNGKIYVGFIKAFDDADTAYSDEVRPPRYADDNIYFVGTTLSVASVFFGDSYFIYERDSYTDRNSSGTFADSRTASLAWLGFHGKLIFQHLLLRAGGIFNWGDVFLNDADSNSAISVRAFLGEIEIGYRKNIINISIIGEGATGSYDDPNDENSFQVIKSSHEFSAIAVDNYGGISIRGSGVSSWYGLCGMGLKAQSTLWDAFNVETRILHFRKSELTFKNSSVHYGDEINFRMEYLYKEVVALFFVIGIFFPRDAYYSLYSIDDSSKGCILEILFGTQANY